ncbi:hypothetical protein L6452_26618 [Arctium lappa]|uniref:Uncharacterized protein n=1 Tax=Arctium lappa TaxID=4217 RepID=A0ACB8ZV15_ARCLA|nr:hypothetical protein L6452_26618 [Arctium lappa]
MESLVTHSIQRVDSDLTSESYKEDIGSTTVVVLLSTSQFITANCGDSRAVLCCATEVIPLLVNHKLARQRLVDHDGLPRDHQDLLS